MSFRIVCFTLAAGGFLVWNASAAGVRVKDMTMVAGARDNQLVGYGLVAGINGEGDKNPIYTVQSVANMLQRFGVNVPFATLQAKNVAAVMVTADIPAFVKPGARLDVTIASLGDAKTLQGGLLLQTPLIGADGKVYAVAQGALSLGGFSAGHSGASVQKNHPTTAMISAGALVEKEIPAQVVKGGFIDLLLRQPDFTSSARMASAINEKFPASSLAMDSTTVRVEIPERLKAAPIDFIALLESIEVVPDTPARIIINERTGTIVASSRIQIGSCAISHGNLTISIANNFNVSQPNPFSETGDTVVTPATETIVTETEGRLVPLPDLPTVEQVASSLNSLGVTPRDMMAIFQTMKSAGVLQAELVIR